MDSRRQRRAPASPRKTSHAPSLQTHRISSLPTIHSQVSRTDVLALPQLLARDPHLLLPLARDGWSLVLGIPLQSNSLRTGNRKFLSSSPGRFSRIESSPPAAPDSARNAVYRASIRAISSDDFGSRGQKDLRIVSVFAGAYWRNPGPGKRRARKLAVWRSATAQMQGSLPQPFGEVNT
jgi:hypothetical protein